MAVPILYPRSAILPVLFEWLEIFFTRAVRVADSAACNLHNHSDKQADAQHQAAGHSAPSELTPWRCATTVRHSLCPPENRLQCALFTVTYAKEPYQSSRLASAIHLLHACTRATVEEFQSMVGGIETIEQTTSIDGAWWAPHEATCEVQLGNCEVGLFS